MDRVWNFFTSVKLAIVNPDRPRRHVDLRARSSSRPAPEKYHQIYEDWAFALLDRPQHVRHGTTPSGSSSCLVLFTVKSLLLHHRPLSEDAEGGAEPEDETGREPRKDPFALGPLEEEGDLFRSGRGKYTEALSSSFAKPRVTEADGQVHLYARPASLPDSAST